MSTSIVLNPELVKDTSPRTYVIFGSPRGGTSMVAGICRIMGLNIGEDLPANCEDPDFNLEILHRQQVETSGHLPDALAKRKQQVETSVHLWNAIAERNQKLATWGWKYPRASHYLPDLISGLRNPHFVCIFRDMVSIAKRPIHGKERNSEGALKMAHQLVSNNIKLITDSKVPTLVLSYEHALMNRKEFCQDIAGFLGSEDSEALVAAENYIEPSGGYQGVPEPVARL
tara:strand:- start:1465 stop:2151 length:687 start_codon:yes stop_codon:yes gene_type:complete